MLNKIHELQDNNILKKIGEMAFYIAFVIETLIVIIDKSAITNPILGRLFQVTFLLCLIKVLATKYEWREYAFIFVFCLLGVFVDQLGDRNEILRIFMFIAACKGIDMKKWMRVYFWILAIGSLLIVLLSVFGILGSVTELKEFKDEGFRELYAFGMGNPNSFHIMIFMVVLLGMYVYHKELRWWCYPPLLGLDYLLYKLTGTRTATILMAAAVAGMFCVKYLEKYSEFIDRKRTEWLGAKDKAGVEEFADVESGAKASRSLIVMKKILYFDYGKLLLKIGSWLSMIVSLAGVELSFYFAAEAWKVYAFNWGLMHWEPDIARIVQFDRALTGRICMLQNFTNRAGSMNTWKLFTVPNHTEYMDLGFVRLFYWYGYIPAIIILLIMVGLIAYLIASEKYADVMLLFIIAVFTVIEAHFISVYIGRSYPVLLLGIYWTDIVKCICETKKTRRTTNEQLQV